MYKSPDGQPIILLVEQTVGGYTKIATVISSDLNLVAQASPGDRIQFERVGLETAYRIKREQLQVKSNILSILELISQVKSADKGNADCKKDLTKEVIRNRFPILLKDGEDWESTFS